MKLRHRIQAPATLRTEASARMSGKGRACGQCEADGVRHERLPRGWWPAALRGGCGAADLLHYAAAGCEEHLPVIRSLRMYPHQALISSARAVLSAGQGAVG